jgi:hypothetical protein
MQTDLVPDIRGFIRSTGFRRASRTSHWLQARRDRLGDAGARGRRVGFDPATSSAPFVATLVDVTGLVIYFSVGLVVLKGTLL